MFYTYKFVFIDLFYCKINSYVLNIKLSYTVSVVDLSCALKMLIKFNLEEIKIYLFWKTSPVHDTFIKYQLVKILKKKLIKTI